MEERRKEPRIDIPEGFRGYFELQLLTDGDGLPLRLLDFSRHGLKFLSPVRLSPEATLECRLAAPMMLAGKTVSFMAAVRYCNPSGDMFIAGCQILGVSSETWLRVFEKIFAFVSERAGTVY